MLDINTEIEILERSASECALISGLATDRRARQRNEQLASEYWHKAEELKSCAHTGGIWRAQKAPS
jgi:hypothetical protein